MGRVAMEREDERWSMYHFSITQPASRLPRLLRKVARRVTELGEIDVYDITYSVDLESGDEDPVATMTVYFDDKPVT